VGRELGFPERAMGRQETRAGEVATAETFLRRLDLNIRTADLTIAIARRVGAVLVTFD
jgi:hypothetical protein